MTTTQVAERIEVSGIVQGVGFRPFVHRVATALGLDGHVGNDSTRVFIEIGGSGAAIDRLVEQLRSDAPPLARIEHITRSPAMEYPDPGFRIVESRVVEGARTLISPDTAVCNDCRRELFDSADRRFGHAFITCTNCGPRLTIIESVPYDRPNTTMAGFVMCADCESEYVDPADRRYHAQPVGCHDCGPVLSYRSRLDGSDRGNDPIGSAVAALARGAVVAVKGLGGYHLSCSATDDEAVAQLRSRKHRGDRPFAVMVADLAHAEEFAHINVAEARLLQSPSAPIVLMRARINTSLSSKVAPENPLLGIMLAYTPVHHLLLDRAHAPLVMTSANRPGEPIAHSVDVIDRLDDLHDAVLDHDRPIHVPCDDSVVRVVGDRLLPIRRARGYAPVPVAISTAACDVLAVGGDLKNTFCVISGDHAWVSQHIGDMENLETVQAFEATLRQFLGIYDIDPQVVAVDAHPGYVSSKWARANYGDIVQQVQHHHAHVGAVMAEHQLDPDQSVLGFAFDGTGYGDDGTIWGGELLIANAHRYERVAHLVPIPLPGGDSAIAHPCRVALAHLRAAGMNWSEDLPSWEEFDTVELDLLRRQLDTGFACVPTTSMGRLFDAVASLLGVRHHISFEAQAAIELEIVAQASPTRARGYRFDLTDEGIVLVAPVLESIIEDRSLAVDTGLIAWRFHDAVAEMVSRLAEKHRQRTGITTVALTGGVFQNALLTGLCVDRLETSSFTVLTHSLVPPNDGGLALGQAYIAAHRVVEAEES